MGHQGTREKERDESLFHFTPRTESRPRDRSFGVYRCFEKRQCGVVRDFLLSISSPFRKSLAFPGSFIAVRAAPLVRVYLSGAMLSAAPLEQWLMRGCASHPTVESYPLITARMRESSRQVCLGLARLSGTSLPGSSTRGMAARFPAPPLRPPDVLMCAPHYSRDLSLGPLA
jgi:hypothetical protein